MSNIIKVDDYYIKFIADPDKDYSNKKYKAIIYDDKMKKIKTVKFGQQGYDHYKDRTPLKMWSHYDHNDKARRNHYRKRHEKILLKDGRPAYKVKFTPAWFSYNYLW